MANWKRVEQALRAIEEYGKLLPLLNAAAIEQLRYRAYTIGKALALEDASQSQLADAGLYVLIDGGGPVEQFDQRAYCQRVASLVSAGVHLLQLRDKALDDVTLLNRARIVREVTSGTPTLFIVNDRADLAVAAGADGVHLGQEDLPVCEARMIVGTHALIGISAHNIEQARQAVLDGADYIGCGPVFPSATKQFDQFAGLDFLRRIVAEITLPAFAIGGINLDNLASVLETGAMRIAVSASVWNSANPAKEATNILNRLRRERS
jgi:thiamine-phosphate pyrophosphorylase